MFLTQPILLSTSQGSEFKCPASARELSLHLKHPRALKTLYLQRVNEQFSPAGGKGSSSRDANCSDSSAVTICLKVR